MWAATKALPKFSAFHRLESDRESAYALEDILTEERTLLDERELEVVAVLRINRTFMEYMKEMHPDLVQGFLAAANKAAEGAGGKQAPQ
jgi:hypothetical protein